MADNQRTCSFQGCDREIAVKKTGLCNGHYLQASRGQELRPIRRGTPIASRLLIDSVREGECLLWTGVVDRAGYGQISSGGRMRRVNRVGYEVAYGDIPAHHDVTQTCGNRRCFAPEHLLARPPRVKRVRPAVRRPTLAERMDRMTEKTDGCWNWTASLNLAGYGQIYVGRINTHAHRVAYELAFGAIPEGLVIDHKCRNRICVNPDHLQAVTQRENSENRGVDERNSSGARGVTWMPAVRKWRAYAHQLGTFHHAGMFDTFDEANAAAIAKRNEIFTNNLADR